MVDVQEFLTDPNQITVAQKEMRLIRSKIRSWIDNDGVSTSSNSIKTPKKPSPTAGKVTSSQDRSKSTESPMASLLKSVQKMESRMDSEFSTFAKVVQSTVRNEVDSEAQQKISTALDSRTKDAIKKHPIPSFIEPGIPKTVTC